MKSLFLLLGLLLATKITWASQAVSIPATVKASLCGDDVIEGPEDCEGADLNGNTCESLGFSSGSLSCDSACEFDETACVAASPSPSPSPNPSPSPTVASPAPASPAATATAASPSLVSQLVKAIFPKTVILPPVLSRFDHNASGKIEIEEMALAVQQWVEGWHLILAEKLAALPSPEASKLVAVLLNPQETEEEIKIAPGEVKELEVFTGRVSVPEEDLERCDLSGDRDCNLIDLSILLYFIAGQ